MQSSVVAACAGYIRNSIKGPLRPDSDSRYARCLGSARPNDGRMVEALTTKRLRLSQSSAI